MTVFALSHYGLHLKKSTHSHFILTTASARTKCYMKEALKALASSPEGRWVIKLLNYQLKHHFIILLVVTYWPLFLNLAVQVHLRAHGSKQTQKWAFRYRKRWANFFQRSQQSPASPEVHLNQISFQIFQKLAQFQGHWKPGLHTFFKGSRFLQP